MPSNKQSVTDQNHNGVPSIDKAFASMWTDETFHDVTLHSADGMAMPANRYALASRCQFFKKMFFGGFQEARTNTVKIGFSGVVLKAVLEYLHTNTTELLVKKPKTKEEATLENFQLVTSLAKAAAYFDLPELGQLTEETTQSYLKVEPSHWLVVLQTATPPPPSSPSSSSSQEQEGDIPIELVKIAFRQLFSHDNQQLMASFLENTNASALKSILQDSCCMSPVSAFVAFKLIEEWGSFGGDDEEEQSGNTTRQQEAMKLIAEHVTLADIPPSMLSTKVKQSGLVTEQQLMSAFTSQAFRLEETNVFLQWKRSRSNIFTSSRDYVWKGDCIDCEPMVAGKHQWRIQIQRASVSHSVLVGVVSAAKVRKFMAGNVGMAEQWVLYGGHQTFQEGSLVTLTLNLRADDENNGSLSISVNAKTCKTFRNLHEKLDDGGFVPVVAGQYPGDAFELLDKSQV